MDASMSPSHRKTTTPDGSQDDHDAKGFEAMKPLSLAWAAIALATVAVAGAAAEAAPKKKFHFELTAVTAKPEIKPDVAKAATPRIEGQVKKVFDTHPQLVGKLEAAPDPKANAEGYRKYLGTKRITSA